MYTCTQTHTHTQLHIIDELTQSSCCRRWRTLVGICEY